MREVGLLFLIKKVLIKIIKIRLLIEIKLIIKTFLNYILKNLKMIVMKIINLKKLRKLERRLIKIFKK